MTEYYPHRVRAQPEALAGQWVLNHHDRPVPAGWIVFTHGPWTLATHPALPCVRLAGPGGDTVGWLLGHAVTPDGELARGELRLAASQIGWEAAREQFVDGLGGRFVVVLLAGSSPRLYPDALATLAAVFAPEEALVASTSSLIPLSPSTPYQLEWILATDIPYTKAEYPFGLTPRRGVERVLPNHYLDLSTWTLVRRWPTGELPIIVDTETAHRRVAELASRAIEAVAGICPIQSPLTAGYDSRVLLACSRAVLDRITLFTAHLPGETTGWRDIVVARAIAAKVGLPHTVLPHRRARASDLREFVERTGGEAGEPRGWQAIRTFKQTAPDRATLMGHSADIARGDYWNWMQPITAVTASRLLKICRVPPLPDFVARAKAWLRALPTRNMITVMDLVYAEQSGGCWAGVIEYAEDGYSLLRLAPMCHTEIIRTLMSLPEAYRRADGFEHDLLAAQWPELLEFPINDQLPVGRVRGRYYRTRESLGTLRDSVGRRMRRLMTN